MNILGHSDDLVGLGSLNHVREHVIEAEVLDGKQYLRPAWLSSDLGKQVGFDAEVEVLKK